MKVLGVKFFSIEFSKLKSDKLAGLKDVRCSQTADNRMSIFPECNLKTDAHGNRLNVRLGAAKTFC